MEDNNKDNDAVSGRSDADAAKFAEEHKVGFLRTPENLDELPVLAYGSFSFVAPKTIQLMDYCTQTEDQQSNPWCAAYSAAGFAENVLWRKTDVPPQVDPTPLYAYAKKIDGIAGDGTTLVAALQSLFEFGYFDPNVCTIRVLRKIEHIKYAIHKFGCCLLGMNVTREWYRCNPSKSAIFGEGDTTPVGGHAVLCCGYNRDGVFIQNSWGINWAHDGFAILSWNEFRREFCYGAVLDNCLNNFKING